MTRPRALIATILSEKKDLIRLFVIGAILGFSVGVLSSIFATQMLIPQWIVVLINIFLIVVSFGWLAKDLVSSLCYTEDLQAVVFIDKPRNEVLAARGYVFAEKLSETLKAVRTESKAIYNEWEKDPLCYPAGGNNHTIVQTDHDLTRSYIAVVKANDDAEKAKPLAAARLLEEAVSYVLLEQLSLHLSSYFRNSSDDSFLKEYGREDIPAFLLKNRVLNLLSTPIEQRDIFIDAAKSGKLPIGDIHAVLGPDGSRFSKFVLVLPRGTRIEHSEVASIKIETKRFALELSAQYSGFNAFVDEMFIEKYLGRDYLEIDCRNMAIKLSCRIKLLSLLSGSGWKYYQWLDSFRDEINWSTIKPHLFAMRNLSNVTSPSSKPQVRDL